MGRTGQSNKTQVHSSAEISILNDAKLSDVTAKELRRLMHDMSSVFTGILVSGGLLNLAVTEGKQKRYSANICEEAERGAALLRQARALLTAPEERMDSDKDSATL